MKNGFTVLLNDDELKIECKKKFVKTHFPDFYKATKVDKDKIKFQIDGGNEFFELTKEIFQGKNYDITDENIDYLLELEKQLKSSDLQTKINIFFYKNECDENQIDQHPSIQFLVDLSTLIHRLSKDNFEDISQKIIEKLKFSQYEDVKQTQKSLTDESDVSDQDDNSSEEEENQIDKTLSLKKISIKQLSKLFYYEIVNTLCKGFNSIDQLQVHQEKIELIIQLIKDLDTENNKKSKEKSIYLSNFIDYVFVKYSKLKTEKNSITNYRQETYYLIHYLLSNKLIKISQIQKENEDKELYFLEFYSKSEIDDFFSKNQKIVDFLKDKENTKNTKKNKQPKNESVSALLKIVKNGLIQDTQFVTTFLNDDIGQFKKLFENDKLDSYKFPEEVAELSCLSSLNESTLIELSAFFGSLKIFEYLNKMRLEYAIVDLPELSSYVIIGQHPQIIKAYLSGIDTGEKDNIYEMLSFCVNHHFYDTYDMILNVIEESPKVTVDQIDQYMKKCVSRCYFDFIPLLLKEGATINNLLNLFCKTNNEIGIQYLLQFDYVDVNSEYNNKTPLEYCIDNKNSNTMILLFDNDYINMLALDAKSTNGEKIIHTLCRLGCSKAVSYLIHKHLYNVNAIAQNGMLPIHFACLGGDYETTKIIVNTKKVRIRTRVTKGQFKKQTALHFACKSGNANILKLLLDSDRRFDVNCLDNKKKPPMIYAIKNDSADCIKLLLANDKIDLTIEYKGYNFLEYAFIKDKTKVFDILLKSMSYDPNKPCQDDRVILIIAIENQNVQIVKSILKKFEKSVDVNIYTNEGQTPLIIACELENIEIVNLLLKNKNIDVNKPSEEEGNTPFITAAKTGNIDILNILMERNDIDLYAKNKDGMSAIHAAFFAEKIDGVKLLIPRFRDNLNDKAGNGQTLFQMAYKKNIELAKLLMNQPEVDVNFYDEDGLTPFLSAAQEGNLEMIKLLLENQNCDPNIKSEKDGRNAFMMAVESKNVELIKFFIDMYKEEEIEQSKSKQSKNKNKKAAKKENTKSVDITDPKALSIALSVKNKEILEMLINCQFIDINQLYDDKTFLCELVSKIGSNYNSYYSYNNDSDDNHSVPFDYNEILDIVLSRNDIDVNKPSPAYSNKACLHIACSSGYHDIKLIQKLLKIDGIDINQASDAGTPLFLLIKCQSSYFDKASYEKSSRNNYYYSNNDDSEKRTYWHEFLSSPNLDVNKGGTPNSSSNLFSRYYQLQRDIRFGPMKNEMYSNDHFYYSRKAKQTIKKMQIETMERNKKEFDEIPKIQTPLELAIENKYDEIANAMIKIKSLDINHNENPRKQTPLHLAIYCNSIDLIKKITKRNDVRFDIQDENGDTPLLFALRNYHPELAGVILDLLNKEKVIKSINIPNDKLSMPLFLVPSNKNSDIFNKFLTIKNVDYDVRDCKGRTAVYLLVKSVGMNSYSYTNNNDNKEKEIDYVKRIKKILQKNPSLLNIPNKHGKTPLFESIKQITNHKEVLVDIVLYFLDQKNIDISVPEDLRQNEEEEEEINEENKKKKNIPKKVPFKYASLVHVASSKKVPNVVEKLLPLTVDYYSKEKEPDVKLFTQRDSHGNTLLSVACNNNDIDTIKVIVDFILNPQNGIDYNNPEIFDINVESSQCQTPLQKICGIQIYNNVNISEMMNKIKEVIENILSFESLDINLQSSNDKRTALHYACYSKNEDFVDLLINNSLKPIDPNICDNNNRTPLLIAVENNQPKIVKSLLKIDSLDVNLPLLPSNQTALDIAVKSSYSEIVALLMNDKRTDPNYQLGESKATSLMYSIQTGENMIFDPILNNDKIDLSLVDENGLTVLHYACKNNKVNFVEALLRRINEIDQDILINCLNKQAKNGLTALHYACLNNNKHIVQLLVNFELIDPNLYDAQGRTPLIIASYNKNESVAKRLLRHAKTNVNLPLIRDNKTALYFACENWNDKLFAMLLKDQRTDPNIPKKPSEKTPLIHTILTLKEAYFALLLNHDNIDLTATDKGNRTALHYACKKGNLRFIKDIINKINENDQLNLGSFLNHQTNKGLTPYHYACLSGNKEVILYLFELCLNPENQINIMIKDKKGMTPFDNYLNNSIGTIENDVCEAFLTVNGKENKILINVNILDLCYKGHYEILKFIILNCSFDVNAKLGEDKKDAITLLHFLCKNQIVDLINDLINLSDIDLNQVDEELKTPLHYAVIYGSNSEVIQLLIESDKCDINAKDKLGFTALHYACQLGKINLIETFISHSNSVDVNAQDNEGSTPLHILAKLEQFDSKMNEILLNSNCDPNIKDNKGNTPIHIACINENNLFVSSLIEFCQVEIDINAINKKYQTPLFIVCMNNLLIIFETLFNSKLIEKIDINLTSPIFIAAFNENFFLFQKLFRMEGLDVNCNRIKNDEIKKEYDFDGLNLMHVISSFDEPELLLELIESGQFDVNELTDSGVTNNLNGTPLIIALKNNRIENFNLLVNHYGQKLNLDLADGKGKKVIHYCNNRLGLQRENVLKKLQDIDENIVDDLSD